MWFFYALAFAVISSFSIIIAKKVMKDVDQYAYLLLVSIFTFPFLFLSSLAFYGIPRLDPGFWMPTITGTAISVLASLLVYKAIRESEISLVNPISSFNPVFTTIVSFIFLGEKLKFTDTLGILLIVLGAYFLQLSKSKEGLFAPFTALVNHKGVRLAIVAYLLWSITPAFEKTAILYTSPQNPPFAAFIGKTVAILLLVPVAWKKSITPIRKALVSWKWILLDGILGGLGISAAFIAYSLSPLGIATAVFKLSVIIVPVLGWLFFKEKGIKERLAGSFVMLLGVIFLVV